MKHNMVSINRAGQASTMRKMINDVKKKLDSGSTIIIFPEGTRKKPRAKADYKTGFIGIYNTSKRRLQPVALNSGLFWQKGLKIKKIFAKDGAVLSEAKKVEKRESKKIKEEKSKI